MQRRGFLASMFAAAAAPAIVRAGSLMPIQVPRPELILPDHLGCSGNFTVESFMWAPGPGWTMFAVTRNAGQQKFYFNGEIVNPRRLDVQEAVLKLQRVIGTNTTPPDPFANITEGGVIVPTRYAFDEPLITPNIA